MFVNLTIYPQVRPAYIFSMTMLGTVSNIFSLIVHDKGGQRKNNLTDLQSDIEEI